MADDGGIILSTPPPLKPKGLIDAISEIEQFSVCEKLGSEIPKNFFTLKNKLEFFEVGFKGSFMSGLITAILTPIAIGVLEEMIPVFGSSSPTAYDKFFVFIVALSYSIGYGFFIASIGKFYIGKFTRTMINNFVGGVITGAILKLILAFIFFHFMYMTVLTNNRIIYFLKIFESVLDKRNLIKIYHWITAFKPVLLTSSYFLMLTTVIFISVPMISITLHAINHKRKEVKLE